MLELPPKIRIGYKDYKIEVLPDEDREKHIGYCMPQHHRIQLATDLEPTEVVNTFIHEQLHAIFNHAEFEFHSQETEESVVSCVANGLTQIFKDNPDIVKWMVESCQRDTNGKTSKAR